MSTQPTQPPSPDENTNKLIAIENRLNTIENGQRVTSRRAYLFNAGLMLMVAGLPLAIGRYENSALWGLVLFIIGALLFVFSSRIVK